MNIRDLQNCVFYKDVSLPVTPRSDAESRKKRFFRIPPDSPDPASERGGDWKRRESLLINTRLAYCGH